VNLKPHLRVAGAYRYNRLSGARAMIKNQYTARAWYFFRDGSILFAMPLQVCRGAEKQKFTHEVQALSFGAVGSS